MKHIFSAVWQRVAQYYGDACCLCCILKLSNVRTLNLIGIFFLLFVGRPQPEVRWYVMFIMLTIIKDIILSFECVFCKVLVVKSFLFALLMSLPSQCNVMKFRKLLTSSVLAWFRDQRNAINELYFLSVC